MRMQSVLMLCLAFFSAIAEEGQKERLFTTTSGYYKVSRSEWNEYKNGNEFVMQERTFSASFGLEGALPSQNASLPVTWLVEGSFGITRYKGGDILTNEPSKSIELYAGARAEITSHVRMVTCRNFTAGPFLTFGHTIFVKTAGPEIWNISYTRLGVETESRLFGHSFFTRSGIVLPLVALDHGLHANIGYEDGFYMPRGRASFMSELGIKLENGPAVSFVLDSLRFDRSPGVTSHKFRGPKTLVFAQPDTKSYSLSIKVSYVF